MARHPSAIDVEVRTADGWTLRGERLAAPDAPWVAVLGHAAGRSMRGRRIPRTPLPAVLPRGPDGVACLDDPWSYALLTGRPATLSAPP